jgi:glutamate-1-semialdehyde 2,1-aminomutase
MGKVIGGGLPVGAYGGKKEIMQMVAPAGPMYQAGTLSGNPLAMTAGIKTLDILSRPGSYEHLEKITSRLSKGLVDIAHECGHPAYGASISGMFGLFFCDGPVKCFEDATKSDAELFGKWHRGMLLHHNNASLVFQESSINGHGGSIPPAAKCGVFCHRPPTLGSSSPSICFGT